MARPAACRYGLLDEFGSKLCRSFIHMSQLKWLVTFPYSRICVAVTACPMRPKAESVGSRKKLWVVTPFHDGKGCAEAFPCNVAHSEGTLPEKQGRTGVIPSDVCRPMILSYSSWRACLKDGVNGPMNSAMLPILCQGKNGSPVKYDCKPYSLTPSWANTSASTCSKPTNERGRFTPCIAII